MRRMLLPLILLLGVTVLAAQQSPSSAAPDSPRKLTAQANSSAPNSTVIRGCLSGSTGNYTLTDQNGMQYQVNGDDATLRSMVGREVEISGLEPQQSALNGQSDQPAGNAAAAVQASNVRAVSSNCNKRREVSPPPDNGMNPKGTPESSQPPKPE